MYNITSPVCKHPYLEPRKMLSDVGTTLELSLLSLYTPVSLSHDQLNIKTLDLQHTSGFYMAVFVWGLNSQYEKLGHSLDHDRIITITIS